VKKTPDSVSTREYTRILKELELAHNEALKAYHIDQLESEFIRTSTDPIDQVKQASDPERDLAILTSIPATANCPSNKGRMRKAGLHGVITPLEGVGGGKRNESERPPSHLSSRCRTLIHPLLEDKMYTQKEYWGVSYRIYDRCLAMGLKKIHALDFERVVSSWIQHSGPEWVARRLKDLKLDLIREKAGLPLLCWVRKNRRGDWYGVLGTLQRMARRNKAGFSLAVNCFMAASALKPPVPTEKHIATMRKNLSAEPVSLDFSLQTSL
jgi:hypothetical protein